MVEPLEPFEDPKGLSDAIVAIQKLLKVIQDSKGYLCVALVLCVSFLSFISWYNCSIER